MSNLKGRQKSSNEKKVELIKPLANKDEKQANNDYMPKELETFDQSLIYTKKLIIIAVSSLTYLRGIFPQNAFTEREFENMKLMILQSSSTKFKDAKVITEWLKGAFDALEKKYLKTLTLAIHLNENSPQDALETYDLTVTYNNEKIDLVLETKAGKSLINNAKKASLHMMKAILIITQTLESLPSESFINMKLNYYDRTPADYEPNGFKACNFENYNYINGCETLKVGSVNTHWHTVKFDFHVPLVNIKDIDKYNESLNETANESNSNIDSNKGFKPIKNSRKLRLKDIKEDVSEDEEKTTSNTNLIKKQEQNKIKPLIDEKNSAEFFQEPKPKMQIYKPTKSSNSKSNQKKNVAKKAEEEKNKQKEDVQHWLNETKISKDDDEKSTLIRQMKELTVTHSPTLISSSNNRSIHSFPESNEIIADTPENTDEYVQMPILKIQMKSCECKLNDDDDGLILLKCEICNNLQHAICYNILLKNKKDFGIWKKAGFKHYCNKCALQARELNLKPTDEILIKCSESKIFMIFIWRRFLYWCYSNSIEEINKIMINEVFKVDKTFSDQIIKKLIKDNLITSIAEGKEAYLIDLAELKKKIDSMFFSIDYLTKKLDPKKSKDIELFRDQLNKSVHDYSFESINSSHNADASKITSELTNKDDEKKLAKAIDENNQIAHPTKRRSRSRSPVKENSIKKRFKSSITKRSVGNSAER